MEGALHVSRDKNTFLGLEAGRRSRAISRGRGVMLAIEYLTEWAAEYISGKP